MSCEICGRNSCIESFHSFEEQELFEARKEMSSDVDELRRTIQDQARQIKDLENKIEELRGL